MTDAKRAQEVARDIILGLLSDEETAKVSTAEGVSGLTEGAEYLDLEHLDRGIQRAKASTAVTMGHILPRNYGPIWPRCPGYAEQSSDAQQS
jgi:hypothetical protein